MSVFRKVKKGVEFLISLPKSFYVSWRLTSFKKALYLPVFVRYNVKLLYISGRLIGGGKLRVGFNNTGIFDVRFQRAILSVEGTIEVKGNVNIGSGSRVEVGKGAVLSFGGKVSNSAGVTIVCGDRISIGGNTVISWNTLIIDTDFHYVRDLATGLTRSMKKPIVIGANAWICVGSTVLKGSHLPNGSILSVGSILNKGYEERNCMLAGNPAIIVRKNLQKSDEEIQIFESKNEESTRLS